jgi:class 3 adenylate cyclase
VFARLDSYAQLSEHGRYLSEHITGARLITTTGPDILPWAGEFDSIIDEMEEFVTGARGVHAATRLLAAVLFTDIVDSTVRAAEVGDRQWRAVLDEFDVNVGRLLARHDGILVKTTGDGILARFRRAGTSRSLRRGHGAHGRRRRPAATGRPPRR